MGRNEHKQEKNLKCFSSSLFYVLGGVKPVTYVWKSKSAIYRRWYSSTDEKALKQDFPVMC
jgi:hypothetical protein